METPTAAPESIRARRLVASAIVVLTIASLWYRGLVAGNLQHGAALFIGLPALIGVLTVLMARPRSLTGTLIMVVTIALCVSGIVLGEAMVCILFAAPLFYLVAIVAGMLVTRFGKQRGGRVYSVAGLALLSLMSLEGMTPSLGFSREGRVEVSRVVAGAPDLVLARLGEAPRFTTPLPAFFRTGFPTPAATSGSGVAPGDRRTIEFRHHQHPGSLTLTVATRTPTSVRFVAVSDDSYITHWLRWREALVRVEPVGPGRSRVTWTIHYWRRLDPAWYFGPLEQFGVRLAAGYLAENLTDPGRP